MDKDKKITKVASELVEALNKVNVLLKYVKEQLYEDHNTFFAGPSKFRFSGSTKKFSKTIEECLVIFLIIMSNEGIAIKEITTVTKLNEKRVRRILGKLDSENFLDVEKVDSSRKWKGTKKEKDRTKTFFREPRVGRPESIIDASQKGRPPNFYRAVLFTRLSQVLENFDIGDEDEEKEVVRDVLDKELVRKNLESIVEETCYIFVITISILEEESVKQNLDALNVVNEFMDLSYDIKRVEEGEDTKEILEFFGLDEEKVEEFKESLKKAKQKDEKDGKVIITDEIEEEAKEFAKGCVEHICEGLKDELT